MAMGTQGTLSHVTGQLRVGRPPSKGELVRAMADMLLVGLDGYKQKYIELAAAIAQSLATIEASGMKIIHGENRIRGSTVVAIEDPSGVMGRKLKKLGHSTATIFDVCPRDPSRCQSGFQLSLTPHCLREVKGGKTALSMFTADLIKTHERVRLSYPSLAKRFPENSLAAYLLSGGNEDLWAFALLKTPGLGREAISLVLRRLYSAILDSGVACSDRHLSPLKDLLKRLLSLVVAVLAVMRLRRHRSLHKLRCLR